MYTPVKYEPKICGWCQRPFEPNRKDKVYCCNTCQKSASKRRQPDWSVKHRARTKLRQRPYSVHKKDFCECCGFKAIHPCQLDVDHIDGDHKNNEPDNLQTLCSNCHRLKTWLNKDWDKRKAAEDRSPTA
jgi:hypothetical protein